MMKRQGRPLMYGTAWCPQTRATRRLLDQHGVRYRYVDIDRDEDAARRLMRLARGYRSVPTLVLPDGRVLVEPGRRQLRHAFGLPDAPSGGSWLRRLWPRRGG